MKGIVPALGRRDKRRLIKNLRKCKNGRLKTRYQMVKNLLEGRSVADTSRALGVAESTVRRVAARFREAGEAGLVDRREENGERKLDEDFLGILYKVVMADPPNYGWRRPTWTRELLVKTMRKLTGQKIHMATMSRALKQIGARRGRPKPTVDSPGPSVPNAGNCGKSKNCWTTSPKTKWRFMRMKSIFISIRKSVWTGWSKASRNRS